MAIISPPCCPRRSALRNGQAALLVAASLSIAAVGFGQSQRTNPGEVNPGNAYNETRHLAKTGNIVAIEAAAAAASRNRPGTAYWHLEITQRLTQLMYDLSANGETVVASQLATKALEHLLQAERVASTPKVKANACYLAGEIYDRFVGDKESAKASYEAADRYAPDKSDAKRRLKQIEKGEPKRR